MQSHLIPIRWSLAIVDSVFGDVYSELNSDGTTKNNIKNKELLEWLTEFVQSCIEYIGKLKNSCNKLGIKRVGVESGV